MQRVNFRPLLETRTMADDDLYGGYSSLDAGLADVCFSFHWGAHFHIPSRSSSIRCLYTSFRVTIFFNSKKTKEIKIKKVKEKGKEEKKIVEKN